jgi:hypothetical protein
MKHMRMFTVPTLVVCCALAAFGCSKPAAPAAPEPAKAAATTTTPAAAPAPAAAPQLKPVASAEGETWIDEPGGYQFTTPKGWTTDNDDDGVYSRLTSPDETIIIDVYTSEVDEVEGAAENLGKSLATTFTNFKLGEGKDLKTDDGMDVWTAPATGQFEGEEMKIFVAILAAKKPVIIVLYGTPESVAANDAAIGTFFDSIRRYTA